MSEEKRSRAAFYRAANGAEPARKWLLDMSDEDRRALGYDVATAEFGWPVHMLTCRPMGQGLCEIRSNLSGNRISRVFFSIADGHMVLLYGVIEEDPGDAESRPRLGPQTHEGG